MTSSVAAHEDAVVDEEVSGGHDGPEALRKAKEEVVGLWKTEYFLREFDLAGEKPPGQLVNPVALVAAEVACHAGSTCRHLIAAPIEVVDLRRSRAGSLGDHAITHHIPHYISAHRLLRRALRATAEDLKDTRASETTRNDSHKAHWPNKNALESRSGGRLVEGKHMEHGIGYTLSRYCLKSMVCFSYLRVEGQP